MEYVENKILYAIFKQFLENPQIEKFVSKQDWTKEDLRKWFPKELLLEHSPTHEIESLIWRQIFIFASEYLLDKRITSFFSLYELNFTGLEYLNRSGKQLFNELKDKYENT